MLRDRRTKETQLFQTKKTSQEQHINTSTCVHFYIKIEAATIADHREFLNLKIIKHEHGY